MRPVFIGGCERSGTTMLSAMLAGHPEVLAVPESHFKFDAFQQVRDWDKQRVDAPAMIQSISEHWRSKYWRPLPTPSSVEDLTSYRDVIFALVKRYAEARGHEVPSTWVDHTAANLMYLPSLVRLFPQARFIHLVRDGRAYAASLMRCDWGPVTALHAAKRWKMHLSYGLAAERGLHAERVMRIRYENLVAKPSALLAKICDHLGINFRSRMEHGGQMDRATYNEQIHALVGDAPDPDRATAWREELDARDIEIFESEAKELLELMGYESITSPGEEYPPRYHEKIKMTVQEVVQGKIVDRVRRYIRRSKHSQKAMSAAQEAAAENARQKLEPER